jgi:uncharacterized protein (DUF427 family)
MISDTPASPTALLPIEACRHRVRAMFAGHVIADSVDVLVLHLAGRRPMHFFPQEDVEIGYLGETRETATDLNVGQGRCYTWAMEGEIIERAACIFDDIRSGAEALAERIWLSEDVFEIYELTADDLAVAPRARHAHGSTA